MKKYKKYNDFVGLAIGGILGGTLLGVIIGKIIAWAIDKTVMDPQLIDQIKRGIINESVFVKNFSNMLIRKFNTEIPVLMAAGGAPQINPNDAKQIKWLKEKIKACKTLSDLLKLFPNDPRLVKMQRLFKEARGL